MKTQLTVLLIITFLFYLIKGASAQEDLLNMIDSIVTPTTEEVAYTFKSTRIINGHSIERMKAGQLDFRINHRFGEVGLGAYDLWGIDQSFVSFDFGYGITDRIMVGIRRSTYKKMYDGSLKLTLVRQSKGEKNFPLSISYYTNVAINTLKYPNQNYSFNDRLSYTHQLLVAHKLNEAISLQIMPTFVHRNRVAAYEQNDTWALGFGGRYKFHRRVAFMAEYFATNHTQLLPNENNRFQPPISFGFDIETGGHVFQIFLTNARIMEESGFINETQGNWDDGNFYFGFNISRVFSLKR